MINFISNLPHDLRSGGFSAMNAAALAALRTAHDVQYTGPINPRVVTWQKAVSKALRVAGAPGDFYFFSRRRLNTIAREVEAQCGGEATLDFFHGFTPWIHTKPGRPYIAWSDCTFHDYIDIFHRRGTFRTSDLEPHRLATPMPVERHLPSYRPTSRPREAKPCSRRFARCTSATRTPV